MVLQEGEWLGQQAKQMLVSLNDLGLLWVVITGTSMPLQKIWPVWHAKKLSIHE
ncbi:MAG: hypothetical protein AB8A46_00535 [Prochlorococcus sp.]|nr:hypothetical protein [Prochlorococcaceae cyanobacterium ETNP18_MAG_1]